MMPWSELAAAVLFGLLASALSCVPGLHVYNVLGLVVLLACRLSLPAALPSTVYACAFGSAIAAYSVAAGIPAVYFQTPDESAALVVLPSRRLARQGQALEAVLLMATGAFAAAAVLVIALPLLGPLLLPVIRGVLHPHLHWIVWCVICFMLLAEWPRGGRHLASRSKRLLDAWRTLGASLVVFLLSGLLGLVLFYRPPYAAASSFQGLMPAFVGLYALPWVLTSLVFCQSLPPQHGRVALPSWRQGLHGTVTGVMGGALAAFIPGVTGGVGGMLASHATAMRGDREFLVSQGASRLVYYVGGFALLFVPGLHLRRGGGAALFSSLAPTAAPGDLCRVAGAAAIGAALALLLVPYLARAVARIATYSRPRVVSSAVLVILCALVVGMTGLVGLGVMLVASGIGLIPGLYGARRMNCLAVILVPVACNLSGIGDRVAGWFGLL